MKYHADIDCIDCGSFQSARVICANTITGIYYQAIMAGCWPKNIRQPLVLDILYILRRVRLMSVEDKVKNHIDDYTLERCIQYLKNEK